MCLCGCVSRKCSQVKRKFFCGVLHQIEYSPHRCTRPTTPKWTLGQIHHTNVRCLKCRLIFIYSFQKIERKGLKARRAFSVIDCYSPIFTRYFCLSKMELLFYFFDLNKRANLQLRRRRLSSVVVLFISEDKQYNDRFFFVLNQPFWPVTRIWVEAKSNIAKSLRWPRGPFTATCRA